MTRWWCGWLVVLVLAWVVLVRVPLVLNAASHLDSDLAVDGLTLADALQGHWRWHYPGTPHMGILPVLLSWPQAAVFGVGPETLVSGGVIAYGLLVLAVFALGWVGFGRGAACWSLVPLAFASTGTVWLSGRITGGHLLTAAWYAATLALLAGWLKKEGWKRAAVLGLWCGLGLYLDRMTIFALAAVVAVRCWPGDRSGDCCAPCRHSASDWSWARSRCSREAGPIRMTPTASSSCRSSGRSIRKKGRSPGSRRES